jgi:uncharacterized membrane protein (UPF0127 family)
MSNASAIRATSWLLALVCTLAVAAPQENAPEPLSAFPRSQLEIASGAKRVELTVWVADTPSRRAQGLMFVTDLRPLTGMLFVFPEPQPVSMWMKNTRISLDMLFVAADGKVIRIAPKARPESLATISSMGIVTGVIEIAGGEAERLGIHSGDRVIHPAFGST